MTPPAVADRPLPYATIPRRAAAAAIDVGLAWAAYTIAIALIDPGIASEYPTTGETVVAALIVLTVGGLWLAYLALAQWRWGQTLGMATVGIYVAREPDGKVSPARALVRSLLLVVDWLVGPLLIAVSARRQRLGDRLANTVVLMSGDHLSAGAAGAVDTGAPAPPAPGPPAPPGGEGPGVPPRSVASTWGPGRVGIGILVLLVLSLVEVAIVSIFDPGLDSLGARLAAQALLAATLVGVAFSVAADHGFPGTADPAALGLRRPLRSPFAIAAAAYVGYVIIALVYSSLVHPEQRDITRDLGVGQGDLGTVIAGILIVGMAPISEEIFFRGFIFGGFRRRMPFLAAALLSGVVFGLFHYTGSGSLTVLPVLAVLGLALAWVYERTGSIYPTIALHMLNNAFAFAILTS